MAKQTEMQKAFKLEDFFTAEKAEKGVRLELVSPTGAETEHWIEIQGVDSKAYRRAHVKMQRQLAKNVTLFKDDLVALDEANELAVTETIASVVSNWSFELECSFDNVVNLLTNAPQIETEIDKLINNRNRFFAMPPVNCSGI